MKNYSTLSSLPLLVGSLIAVLIVTACVNIHQDPNEYHAKPSEDMAIISNVPLEKLQAGHAIYKQQCSKCHEARLPGAIPSEEWHKVIPGMAWNAGLSKEDEATLSTYIISACRFIEKEDEH